MGIQFSWPFPRFSCVNFSPLWCCLACKPSQHASACTDRCLLSVECRLRLPISNDSLLNADLRPPNSIRALLPGIGCAKSVHMYLTPKQSLLLLILPQNHQKRHHRIPPPLPRLNHALPVPLLLQHNPMSPLIFLLSAYLLEITTGTSRLV